MKNKKLGNIITILFLLFFVGVFIYSLINIIKWKLDSNKTKDEIKEIYEKVEVKEVPDSNQTEIIENDGIDPNDPYWKYIKMSLIDVNFDLLKETNPDTVGWIKINGTNINYPFVKTDNNDYYLSHTFDKSYNNAGWVFMDYRNSIDKLDKNTILYAHGRLDNTMFGSLRNILKSDWYYDDNNYIVRLSTDTENTLWQVFSVYRIPTTNDYIQTDFTNDTEYENFLNMIHSRSKFDFNTSVSASDNILTLSTCFDDYEKVVLHAKLIKRETKNIYE